MGEVTDKLFLNQNLYL